MKGKEELKALKKEVEILNEKLAELTDDELSAVTGGTEFPQIIEDYLKGKLGDDEESKKRLKDAGYDYQMVMRAVEMRLKYSERFRIEEWQ